MLQDFRRLNTLGNDRFAAVPHPVGLGSDLGIGTRLRRMCLTTSSRDRTVRTFRVEPIGERLAWLCRLPSHGGGRSEAHP